MPFIVLRLKHVTITEVIKEELISLYEIQKSPFIRILDLTKMKIYVGAPFCILAIFFSLIELCSPYSSRLTKGEMQIDPRFEIFYPIENNKQVWIQAGVKTKGLLDGEMMVCALEDYNNQPYVRALITNNIHVKVLPKTYIFWNSSDKALYGLEFDKPLK
ncbi:uncharacterized protein LOC117172449 [Belonocnema kinseyi]|uniref:uncharacterized protein LOC117172449 n=1 Tax=Belonocnema kinseyi TaxID=2817044 RepID=UPI00143DEE36|nr:uncharacterized protein LOC117172449 [Belonocnema kinseyi]